MYIQIAGENNLINRTTCINTIPVPTWYFSMHTSNVHDRPLPKEPQNHSFSHRKNNIHILGYLEFPTGIEKKPLYILLIQVGIEQHSSRILKFNMES